MKKLIIIFFLILSTALISKGQDQIIQDHFLYVSEENCTADLPNYLDSVIVTDNCGVKSVIQEPPAGTVLDATTPQYTVTITATDDFNNVTKTSFIVTLLDTVPPRIEYNYLSLTVGNTEVFGSKANTTQRRAVPYYPTDNGIISHIHIFHGASDTTSIILGVYTDKDGKPDSLLTKTEKVLMNGIEGWQRVPVIHTATFKSGKLWVSFNSDGASEFRYGTGNPIEFGRVAASTNHTFADGMPMFFGPISGDPSSAIYSVYFEYTRGSVVYTPEIINDMYKHVENYVGEKVIDLGDKFDWSTYAIDSIIPAPSMINDIYNVVENYIAGEVEDYTYEFDWTAMNKVYYVPKSKPMNTIY